MDKKKGIPKSDSITSSMSVDSGYGSGAELRNLKNQKDKLIYETFLNLIGDLSLEDEEESVRMLISDFKAAVRAVSQKFVESSAVSYGLNSVSVNFSWKDVDYSVFQILQQEQRSSKNRGAYEVTEKAIGLRLLAKTEAFLNCSIFAEVLADYRNNYNLKDQNFTDQDLKIVDSDSNTILHNIAFSIAMKVKLSKELKGSD